MNVAVTTVPTFQGKSPRKSLLSLASDTVATKVGAMSVRHKQASNSKASTKVQDYSGSKTTRSITIVQLEDDLTKAAARCSMMKKMNEDASLVLPEVMEIEASEIIMDKGGTTPALLLLEESKKHQEEDRQPVDFDEKYFMRQETSQSDTVTARAEKKLETEDGTRVSKQIKVEFSAEAESVT